MLVSCLILSLLISSSATWAAPPPLQRLTPGNSIAVEDANQILVSPNGTFSSGFYQVGNNSYCFSIWYTKSLDKTVVWMANRDKPVNGHKSKLTLNPDSNLVLTDADGIVVWSSDTVSSGGFELRLLETGNLVVKNQSEGFIWQSFDSPLDTLLPDQPFLKASTLISIQSRGIYLSGFYYLKFSDFNVLNLLYNGPLLSGIYWPDTIKTAFQNGRTPYNSSRIAILNKMGGFKSSDKLEFNASDYGLGPKRRLTIDYDGVLRLYSLHESTGNWSVTWLPSGARIDACTVHGLCGEYGICEYDPLPACTCPPGFVRSDPSDWSKGCKPLVNLSCNSRKEMDFIALPNTDYFGYDWINTQYAQDISLETCRNFCLRTCECAGFGYAFDGTGQCYPKIALRNGYRKPSTIVLMFIKVGKGESLNQQQHSSDLICSASEIVFGSTHAYAKRSNKFRYPLLTGVVVVIGICELLLIGFGWWNVFRNKVSEELANMGYIVLAMGFKRFSYTELKRATKNFRQEIGRGGFGAVYKGELDDGRFVAVKRLDGVLQGDTEFWAEVNIIGKINHKNLVKLWGFCVEKQHKMLVYEFVQNGSLDKHLFSDSSKEILGFDQRYEIAVGTAKGLSYLHEECLEWVLHCDVKPQNILLDEALEPKVADFGMSKFFQEINESGFSKVRGTRGYLAPEWMMNLKMDAKADVYSYGIVVLELISGKNAYGFESSTVMSKDGGSNDMVKWITAVVEEGEVEKVMDPRLMMKDDQISKKKIEKLLKVALLCVREDPNMRPAMSRVVELLTGYEEHSPREDAYDRKKML